MLLLVFHEIKFWAERAFFEVGDPNFFKELASIMTIIIPKTLRYRARIRSVNSGADAPDSTS